MSALKQEVKVADDFKLVYDFTEKPNHTNLVAHEDRAVVAKIRADLVLPEDKILTVDIDFDTKSGYHGNVMMVMDDLGVDLLATAFDVKYGKKYGDAIREEWHTRQTPDAPRKPTYMLVRKPTCADDVPDVMKACGDKQHPPRIPPNSIV